MNCMNIDNHNIVSADQAISIITNTAQRLIDDHNFVKKAPAYLLRGAPGVGKSSIIRDIAKKLNIGFIDIRLAQMERVDICGLPSVNNGMTEWNVPSLLPRDVNSNGILFFDEITSAPADLQVAAYSLVLDRCIPNSNYKLPDGWLIVAAGNRATDRSVVKQMSAALANRFVHFELEANTDDWIKWAVQNDINPAVTGFVSYRPQYLFTMDKQNLEQGWPSPRSWEKVSNLMEVFDDNTELLQKLVFGAIGPAVGTEFMAFRSINKQFSNVLDVLTNPKIEVEIPTRSDEKYAFVSAVIYHLWQAKDAADQKRRVDGFYRVADKLSSDFQMLLIKSAMQGNSKVSTIEAVKHIMSNEAYKTSAAKFAAAMKSSSNIKL